MSDDGLGDMTKPERHRWARPILVQAWRELFPGDEPDLRELQTLQSQSAHDGWYGRANSPPGWHDSNNWGACDYLDGDERRIPGCVGFFSAPDVTVNGTPITPRFRRYASPVDGARDFIHEALIVRGGSPVVDSGNFLTYCEVLRASHYFVAPAADYARAMWGWAKEIAPAIGEPLEVRLDEDPPEVSAPSGGGAGGAVLLLAVLALGSWALGLWES